MDVEIQDRIPVTGVNELVLEVVDLEESVRFYSEALGLPVVERWKHREAVWVMAGERTRIGLWRPQVGIARGRGGVHVHYAMHLSDADYEASVERLRSHGLDVHEEAFDGYRIDGRPSRAAYVTDPDGNVVELWTWDVGQHLTVS
jgi:catechol 2,3-dioxygenase-like lactoylglutathione lyase family enzyme